MNKTVELITIINATQITVTFTDGSALGIKVGDSVDTSALIAAEPESAAPAEEVAPEPAADVPPVEPPEEPAV